MEPNVTTLPLVESHVSENGNGSYDIDALLRTGISAAKNGERDFARLSLTKVTEIDPQCEDAWMWLASISEYPEELLAFLDRVLDLNSDNQKALEWKAATKSLMAKTFVERALAAREEGSTDVLNECLNQALEHDNNCEAAWELKADTSEDENEKFACFERVLEINPENVGASFAIEVIKQRRLQAKFDEAKTAAAAGDRKKALELVDEFISCVSDNPDAWMLRSNLCENEEDKLECFERVLGIDPENEYAARAVEEIKRVRLEASFGEAKAAAVAGKRKKALELVDEFLKSVPDNAEAWVLRSHLALDLDDKMKSLESALVIDPDNAAAKAGYEFLKSTFSPVEPVEVAAVVYDENSRDGNEAEASVIEEPIATVEEPTPADLEAIADVPVVYDDGEVGDPPIAPPMEEELFAASDQGVVTDTKAEGRPIPAPTDEELLAASERPVPETRLASPREPEPIEAEEDVFLEVRDENETPQQAEEVSSGVPCPYCNAASAPQSFQCVACNAVLSLSDLESLISNDKARRDLIQDAVIQMEAEWNLREFNEKELTTLAIGHFNLRNFAPGFTFLQEASRLNPTNVILAGQVNALQIRMDEIARQNEIDEGKPKGKTILVVDDSPTVRKLISGKLEKSGHHVVCACDGVEALERLEAGLPDLVLLDITMPRMDGYEVCRQIRANPAAQDLPVVMISGKDGFFDKVRGRMAGTSGYVTKPFGPETLMKALETYLRPDAEVI